MNRRLVLAASSLLLAAAAASAEGRASCPAQLGGPADGRPFARQIVLEPGTRWANVTEGEVIRFVVRSANGTESSFTWDFDTFGDRNVDLRCIASEGALQHPVKVFISADPRYHGQ